MRGLTSKLQRAAKAGRSSLPVNLDGWEIQARWICQDCSSRLRLSRRITSQSASVGFYQTQTRSVREAPPISSQQLTPQRRRVSGQAKEQATGMKEDLPSHREGRRSDLAKRFSYVMDHLQSNIFIAGQRLNDLTGYSGIEALKQNIESQG